MSRGVVTAALSSGGGVGRGRSETEAKSNQVLKAARPGSGQSAKGQLLGQGDFFAS